MSYCMRYVLAAWLLAGLLAGCSGSVNSAADAGEPAPDEPDGQAGDDGGQVLDEEPGGDDGSAGGDDGSASGDAPQDGTAGDADADNIDKFDIVFSQNFNDNPVGAYSRSTWSEDWGIAEGAWSDPCYDNCTDEAAWAEARLTIEEEADGNRFMRHELFTKGTSPGTSGTSWWLDVGNHEELYLSFRVRFSGDDWAGPVYDGKLPGFCGSAGCPGGGNPPENYEGFSTRYMFKSTNALFFYLYYAGMDLSDGPYGDGLYFDPYVNQPDEWHTVTQRVVMNTPGQANGIVEGFLDGVLVAQKTDMDYRNADDHYISTMYFANFLGGSGEEPTDYGDTPDVDFDDLVVYAYKDDVPDVPRGLEPSPAGRVIEIPDF